MKLLLYLPSTGYFFWIFPFFATQKLLVTCGVASRNETEATATAIMANAINVGGVLTDTCTTNLELETCLFHQYFGKSHKKKDHDTCSKFHFLLPVAPPPPPLALKTKENSHLASFPPAFKHLDPPIPQGGSRLTF